MDLGATVRGKRLGVLDLGRIDRAAARRAKVSGLHIADHDIKPVGDLVYDNPRAHFDGRPVLTPIPPRI